jgi:hypothetical protein
VKNLEVLLIVVPLQCREEQRLCRSAFTSAKLERYGEIGKKLGWNELYRARSGGRVDSGSAGVSAWRIRATVRPTAIDAVKT